ncbi:MAG TPA: TetR/AcrR family transcriptional regulator [Vicinamibacterales bacterium]|nr:TetR/AcrR family transcriptional regulator [Vicinamibacterales bacterium]
MTESTADRRASRRGRKSRPARLVRRQADTRVDILKSAAKAFRRLGYHGATVEQIAAALHMKKGNLYYYFTNKEEILFACHQYSLDRLTQLLEEIEASGASPDAKLRSLVSAFVHTILDELHGTALFLDLEALTPAHLKAVIVRRDKFDRGFRRIIEQGIAAGQFAVDDVKLTTFAMMGAVNWIPRWFRPEGAASSQQIADRFAECFLNGLRRR